MRLDLICKHEFPDGFDIDIDLSCQIRAMALFGPSGSGKTTILSTIAGMFNPDFVRVAIDKETIADTENNIWTPIERRAIGVTPQHSLLFENKTVRENLEFGMPKHRRWKVTSPIVCRKEIVFDDVVDILDLERLLNRYPGSLSGGEQRRVAIGRAILSQPRLLILDEPLSALDHILQNRIILYLKKVIDNFCIPTIIITHNTKLVYELVDSVVMIERGRVINIGNSSNVLPLSTRYQIAMAM